MALEVLYLIRHSKAEGAHPDGDQARSLSAEGRRRISELLPQAAHRGLSVDLCLSSPYLRARQTQELFRPVLNAAREELSSALVPNADVGDAVAELAVWAEAGYARIAVFTHNPLVTDLAGWLLTGDGSRELVFHTPTILAMRFDQTLVRHSGRLLWILHP